MLIFLVVRLEDLAFKNLTATISKHFPGDPTKRLVTMKTMAN